MIFQVFRDTGINYVHHYFAAYGGERYGPVVGSKVEIMSSATQLCGKSAF